MKKPVIIINFLDEPIDNIFINRKLCLECKKKSELVPLIKSLMNFNPLTESKINELVKDYLYKFDGKASERLTNIIFSSLNRGKT